MRYLSARCVAVVETRSEYEWKKALTDGIWFGLPFLGTDRLDSEDTCISVDFWLVTSLLSNVAWQSI
jgi:hypothetical protein